MLKKKNKRLSILLAIFCFNLCFVLCFAFPSFPSTFSNPAEEKYQAIVLGKMVKKQIKKSGNSYITEYKLKTKKWLFKKPYIKKQKYLTIKILGAELLEAGITIKASCSPDYIPMKKEAMFLLEQNKLKQKNVFTLSKDGVIYKEI